MRRVELRGWLVGARSVIGAILDALDIKERITSPRFWGWVSTATTAAYAALSAVIERWAGQPLVLQLLLVVAVASFLLFLISWIAKIIVELRGGPKMNVRYRSLFVVESKTADDFMLGDEEKVNRAVISDFSITNQSEHDLSLFFKLRIPIDIGISKLPRYESLELDLDPVHGVPRLRSAVDEPLVVPKERPSDPGVLDFVIDPIEWLIGGQGKALIYDEAELLIYDSYSERTRVERVGDRYHPPLEDEE